MAFTNALVEIRVGNVESLVHAAGAPLPRRELDRVLNPHLVNGPRGGDDQEPDDGALVYDPARDAVLNGAVPKAKRLLRERGFRVRLRDARCVAPGGERWRLAPGVGLRDYQEEVVARAVEAGHGLLDLATGAGKSRLALAVCARLSERQPTRALWIVTTRTLLAQTVDVVRQTLGIEPGVVGDGRVEPRPFTVALVQALDPERVDLDPWKNAICVFDEGHHAAAASYLAVIRRLDPRFHFYLSAVPVRAGRDQAVLDALVGASLTDGRYSARFLMEKGYAAPIEARFEPCRVEGEMTELPFSTLYRRFVVENPARNGLLVGAVKEDAARGRSVLVLVDHVRHGRLLAGLLGGAVPFVHGGTARGELRGEIARFAAGEQRVLIATSALCQEGVDIQGIEVIVQAGGLKSRVKVLQSVGRGMRRSPGKTGCLYRDVLDLDPAGVFLEHARERIRVLREEGFRVEVVEPLRRSAPEEEIEPAWTYVPSTRRFLLVDSEGRVKARAECLEKSLVPEKLCKRCTHPWCEEGGRIQWRDEQE